MARTSKVRQEATGTVVAVNILSIPVAPPVHVKFLGPLRGLLTHFHGKRSHACLGQGECPQTIHRSGTFFKSYAPVEWWLPQSGRWRKAVLEATANLEEYLRGRKLRGEVWLLSREDPTKKMSPVIGAYCETLPDNQLSQAFDIEPILLRVYHCTSLKLDVTNPMPSQVWMADSADAPPTVPADIQPLPKPQEDPEQRKRIHEMLQDAKRGMFSRNATPPAPDGNEQKPSPAPPAGNGAAGNGHF